VGKAILRLYVNSNLSPRELIPDAVPRFPDKRVGRSGRVGADGGRARRAPESASITVPQRGCGHAKKRAPAMEYAAFAQPLGSFRFSALALHFEQSTFAGVAV
jgi:hypothetical protein